MVACETEVRVKVRIFEVAAEVSVESEDTFSDGVFTEPVPGSEVRLTVTVPGTVYEAALVPVTVKVYAAAPVTVAADVEVKVK